MIKSYLAQLNITVFTVLGALVACHCLISMLAITVLAAKWRLRRRRCSKTGVAKLTQVDALPNSLYNICGIYQHCIYAENAFTKTINSIYEERPKLGDEIEIIYNPLDPRDVYLTREIPTQTAWTLLVLHIILCITLLLLTTTLAK